MGGREGQWADVGVELRQIKTFYTFRLVFQKNLILYSSTTVSRVPVDFGHSCELRQLGAGSVTDAPAHVDARGDSGAETVSARHTATAAERVAVRRLPPHQGRATPQHQQSAESAPAVLRGLPELRQTQPQLRHRLIST